MSTTALALLASGWGVVMGLAPLLQVRRMLASRSSRDVSLGFLAVYAVGFLFWLAYGVALGNAAIVVPNVVSLIAGTAALAVAIRFQTVRGRPEDRPRSESITAL
jgi:MtN3 and saliva related transmembrane protein